MLIFLYLCCICFLLIRVATNSASSHRPKTFWAKAYNRGNISCPFSDYFTSRKGTLVKLSFTCNILILRSLFYGVIFCVFASFVLGSLTLNLSGYKDSAHAYIAKKSQTSILECWNPQFLQCILTNCNFTLIPYIHLLKNVNCKY